MTSFPTAAPQELPTPPGSFMQKGGCEKCKEIFTVTSGSMSCHLERVWQWQRGLGKAPRLPCQRTSRETLGKSFHPALVSASPLAKRGLSELSWGTHGDQVE